VLDRGRLVLQQDLSELQAPTGRIVVDSPDADRVVALLDGRVEARDGATLVVRHGDAAELNARLVGEGIRVNELTLQRRSLEEIVLQVTSAGSDQVSGTGETGGDAAGGSGG
jgi:ABC-2 type transport system ATP-binding protein